MPPIIQTQVDSPPPEFEVTSVWQMFVRMGESFIARIPYIVVGIIVFFIFFFFGRVARVLARRVGTRVGMDPMLADLFGRLASGLSIILGFFAAGAVIFPSITPGDLVAGLGVTSVAIGFAFKDILQNFFAGILILWRRPFRIGDQILTNNYEGTVEDINIRSTHLKTYSGERVVMPNGEVFMHAVLVRTAYGTRRVRLQVGIGYGDDIEEARQIIHQVLKESEGVLQDPGPWVLLAEFAPSSVNFDVYFWVEAEQANVLSVTDNVASRLKPAFDRAKIDMPYPTTVVLLRDDREDTAEGPPDH